MVNPVIASTRSGGPIAAAYATLRHLGDDGYLRLAAATRDAVAGLADAVAAVDGLRLLAEPESTVVCFTATDPGLDLFVLADELAARGWHTQPQLAYADLPASVHLTVTAAVAPRVAEFGPDLAAAVAAARAAGPVRLPGGAARAGRARSTPEALTPELVAGLAAGLGLGARRRSAAGADGGGQHAAQRRAARAAGAAAGGVRRPAATPDLVSEGGSPPPSAVACGADRRVEVNRSCRMANRASSSAPVGRPAGNRLPPSHRPMTSARGRPRPHRGPRYGPEAQGEAVPVSAVERSEPAQCRSPPPASLVSCGHCGTVAHPSPSGRQTEGTPSPQRTYRPACPPVADPHRGRARAASRSSAVAEHEVGGA